MSFTLTREQLADALVQTGAGDRAAFRRVYDATSAKLMGVCLRILHDRALAEDVLQDAYVSIWNRASTFDPGRASPITWLATIARNRSIDRLRSGARLRSDRPLDAAADVADGGELASVTLEKTDDARRLNGCLDELEDKTARVIRTAFFEGLTYEALAEREGAPLGTMKSWIRRGLLRLRTCLEQ